MLVLAAPFVSVPPFQIGGLSVRSLRGLWVTPPFTLCLGGRADEKKRKEKIRKRRVVWSGTVARRQWSEGAKGLPKNPAATERLIASLKRPHGDSGSS